MITRTALALSLVAFMLCAGLAPGMTENTTSSAGKSCLVYVGAYTGPNKSKGIHLLNLDMETGACTRVGLAAEASNPSFLAVHPDKRHLYSVNESDPGVAWKGGAVSAFSIATDTGLLTRINQQPSGGNGPCHLAIDPSGRCVVTANYGSGSAAALRIMEDGALTAPVSVMQHHGHSVDPKRQAGPHAHSATVSPDGRFVLIADLGLDRIMIYRLDAAQGTLTPNDPPAGVAPPGAGPRHCVFHPGGRFVYVVNEMGSSVTLFAWNAEKGAMRELQTVSTLPAGLAVANNTGAEIQAHPNGRFLYASNRGHDSIAIFTIDPATGMLTPAGHEPTGGKTPRGFTVDPTGKFLVAANQNSDNVVVFRIDADSGALKRVSSVEGIGAPVCAKFLMR
jgi:6-phosphogluconolactonase